jgi:hypothetical protein
MSGDWQGTLWTLLVTFCIVIIRCTETFWSRWRVNTHKKVVSWDSSITQTRGPHNSGPNGLRNGCSKYWECSILRGHSIRPLEFSLPRLSVRRTFVAQCADWLYIYHTVSLKPCIITATPGRMPGGAGGITNKEPVPVPASYAHFTGA